jgi:hypothetical protein
LVEHTILDFTISLEQHPRSVGSVVSTQGRQQQLRGADRFKSAEVKEMNVRFERCCGIDVHKKKVVACLLNQGKKELGEFGTMTDDILLLAQWLEESGCGVVALESTGVYRKPIYNILEEKEFKIIVGNAQHMKAVPGRKTDVKDAEWIADLVRHGLIQASYIPGREQRELREMVRYRQSLVEERARELNRIQAVPDWLSFFILFSSVQYVL